MALGAAVRALSPEEGDLAAPAGHQGGNCRCNSDKIAIWAYFLYFTENDNGLKAAWTVGGKGLKTPAKPEPK